MSQFLTEEIIAAIAIGVVVAGTFLMTITWRKKN